VATPRGIMLQHHLSHVHWYDSIQGLLQLQPSLLCRDCLWRYQSSYGTGLGATESEHTQGIKRSSTKGQNQQKFQADKHMVERTFEVGDLVYLRLQPYRQDSIKRSGAEKLQPRFFGPYRINRKVGAVAYELELPQGSKIDNVFHVSCLKRAIGQHITPLEILPPLDEEGQLVLMPEEILEVREKKLRRRIIKEYLVKWKNLPIEDATWESEQVIQEIGSELLVDKQFLAAETIMSPTS
jgi:hypothetical protein